MKRSALCLFSDCQRTSETLALDGTGIIAVFSSRSPDKTTANEDAAMVFPIDDGRCVLAVADGVGGRPRGAHASRISLQRLAGSVRRSLSAGDSLREGILSGFDLANRAVLARSDGSANTLVAASIEHGRVRTYNVGDSGALLFGSRGKLKLQTIAHSPVGYAVEAGMLDEADAMAHEDRHLVSNLVGDTSMHVVMGSALRMRPRDTLLLASDGLFDNLFAEEIVETLRSGPLQQRVEQLADECAVRMAADVGARPHKPDDLTIIAFRGVAG